MKILIAGKVKHTQFVRLQQEGVKRGHQVDGCYAPQLIIKTHYPNWQVQLSNNKELRQYDVIYIYGIYSNCWEWYAAAKILNQENGIKIINSNILEQDFFHKVTYSWEYYEQIKNNILIPKTTVISSVKVVDQVMSDFLYPVIVKGVLSKQGKGVFLCHRKSEVKKVIQDNKQDYSVFALREYIPNNGDLRVFCVNYKAIGAMLRQAKPGEYRNNISLGGKGKFYNLDSNPEIRLIAEKVSRLAQLEITGVDIVIHQHTGKPYLLEYNNDPHFLGFEKYTGINVALEIIKYFEKLVKKK